MSKSSGNILVPLDVSYGSMKHMLIDNFPQYIKFPRSSTKLNITVCDTNRKQIDLNGSDFEFAIKKV